MTDLKTTEPPIPMPMVALSALEGFLEAIDSVVPRQYLDRLNGYYLNNLREAIRAAGQSSPDRDGLIEKLEVLKGNWGGSNPWQEGYLKAIDRAISIVRQHEAAQPVVKKSLTGDVVERVANAIRAESGGGTPYVVFECMAKAAHRSYGRG